MLWYFWYTLCLLSSTCRSPQLLESFKKSYQSIFEKIQGEYFPWKSERFSLPFAYFSRPEFSRQTETIVSLYVIPTASEYFPGEISFGVAIRDVPNTVYSVYMLLQIVTFLLQELQLKTSW